MGGSGLSGLRAAKKRTLHPLFSAKRAASFDTLNARQGVCANEQSTLQQTMVVKHIGSLASVRVEADLGSPQIQCIGHALQHMKA